jgi:hypothetical protein
MDLAERFWSKVRKVDGDGCWEWTASRFNGNGYGCFAWINRKLIGAHRASWMLTHGEIQNGLWVLHKCDNRGCVRPDHLFLGTAVDNARDMVAKKRGVNPVGDRSWTRQTDGIQRGDNNFNARLDAAAVTAIKIDLVRGLGPVALARQYGVNSVTISAILTGKNWNEAPWPEGASFPVDCETANKSRGHKARLAKQTGGLCVDQCGQPTDGTRTRCAACWTARRTKSKCDNERNRREQKRQHKAAGNTALID